MAAERFDAVVIGAGPGGEVAVDELHEAGATVAIVERELIGGECAYWGCMPSKTLLRGPDIHGESRRAIGAGPAPLRFEDASASRDEIVRHMDDARQISGYEERGITVVKGHGRLAGPNAVEAGGRTLATDRVVIATGTGAAVPPIPGLADVPYWTNREATALRRVPETAVVLGGGAVGVELAQMMARFGARVTIVQDADRVLPREERRVGELVGEALARDGIELRLGHLARAARAGDGGPVLALDSGEEVAGEVLLVATGRRPRTEDLGLDTVGIAAGRQGIHVDDRLRAAEGVWAVGDVTGLYLLTHVAKYQARVAVADMLGRGYDADYRAVPRVVFTDPEAAAVGLSEDAARAEGIEVIVERVDLAAEIARPWTYEHDPSGELALVADHDRGVLVGGWAVGPLAGELVNALVVAIRAELPLRTVADTAPAFPTFSEGIGTAVRRLAARVAGGG